jgi:hypothetical protein
MSMPQMPMLYPIQQKLKRTCIKDIGEYFKNLLDAPGSNAHFAAGTKTGICVGSRGIKDISLLLKLLICHIRDLGAEPVIIPCMGSHGGATARGQICLLADYGITESAMGAKISGGMDVVEICPETDGIKIYMDSLAAGCDVLVVMNRIKEHTDFSGDIESGIVKMLAIGLGNHTGASYIHSFGAKGLVEYIPKIATRMIASKNIIGIGIVEDGYSEIDSIEIIPGNMIYEREKELLKYSRTLKAKIPFKKLDYLIIEEMGKNISGTGMDSKVIGRVRYHGVEEPIYPSPDIIVCLRLTHESHGNAAGVGLSDLISKTLYDDIDKNVTYINGRTTKCPERYKIPMFLDDDLTAINTGLEFSMTTGTFQNRIAFIKNTSDLETIYVSEPLLHEIKDDMGIDIISGEGRMIEYDRSNNYISIFK